MINLASYVKTVKSVITANSPVLLLGTTIAGVATTAVLSAKAGWKARGIVDEEVSRRHINDNDFEPLTPQEIAQLVWPHFMIPAATAGGTIAAAVGTHTIHTKRANAMAALYAVTSNKLDDMTERAEALLGPKKTQQLQNEISQRAVDRDPFNEDTEVYMTEDGTELCHDDWSGRWFMSSMAQLESAINAVNRLLIDDGSARLNDWYEYIGLPPIPMGDSFGWSGSKIEGRFGAVTNKDGRPAISVYFHETPKDKLGCL
jgi:hypothetical protein